MAMAHDRPMMSFFITVFLSFNLYIRIWILLSVIVLFYNACGVHELSKNLQIAFEQTGPSSGDIVISTSLCSKEVL